ncbi:HIT family protein [Parvibium lacunae]|uniref:HIT family protein n=2 Tax=Parvibium lacunae TaxID=1888893 RepID=A0A368L578_9BURK|nr:HIT family protein [Parvibium lacunae]
MTDCPLCSQPGGELIWQNSQLRVVRVVDSFAQDHPAFTRVIWQAHVKEMTDLCPAEREQLMAVVWVVEQVQREVLQPTKVNVASFGNVVPHLHWHIIPRYEGDAHWPNPVWAAPNDKPLSGLSFVSEAKQKPSESLTKNDISPILGQYWQELRLRLTALG